MDKSQKSRFNIKVIGIVAFIILGIAFLVYLNRNKLLWGNDSRNTPATKLSELKWPSGPYKIYYRTQEGFFSILTDGTNKQIIYPRNIDYLLLDKKREILVREKATLNLLGEAGQPIRKIFQGPSNKRIFDWRISPDETKVVLQLSDDNKFKDKNNFIVDEIYVVNLQTGQSRQLNNLSELENYKFLNEMLWSADSTKAYLSTTKYLTENEGRELYFAYDAGTDLVGKIGEEKHSPRYLEMKGLESFIKTSPAVHTRRDIVTRAYYYTRTSPDGTKMIDIDYEGNIKVNDQNIIYWSNTTFKGTKEHCRYPGWLPDSNHLTIECFGLRIIEIDSKKVAVLDAKGGDAQWFGQRFEELYNN